MDATPTLRIGRSAGSNQSHEESRKNAIKSDEMSPSDYFANVQSAISTKPRWEVLSNDIIIWFFSFSKFLVYIDLHPDSWPDGWNISDHGVIDGLLHGGFGSKAPICGENDNIEGVL